MIQNKSCHISVNLDKVALVRNARGYNSNSKLLLNIIEKLLLNGINYITLHPRDDNRHILIRDLYEIDSQFGCDININVEGDLRFEIIEAISKLQSIVQYTIVPIKENEKTTERGFFFDDYIELAKISNIIKFLKKIKDEQIKISIFIDPCNINNKNILILSEMGINAVEIHSVKYAYYHAIDNEYMIRNSLDEIISGIDVIKSHNISVNIGHDITYQNLLTMINYNAIFVDKVSEYSIGHNIIIDSLIDGVSTITDKFSKLLSNDN